MTSLFGWGPIISQHLGLLCKLRRRSYSPISRPKLAFASCELEAHVAVAHSLTHACFISHFLTSSDHALTTSCDISLQLSDVEGGLKRDRHRKSGLGIFAIPLFTCYMINNDEPGQFNFIVIILYSLIAMFDI
jgi:hypothetical protein